MSYWRDTAECRTIGGDAWFPSGRPSARALKVMQVVAICNDCPARVACARYALDTNRAIGVWGGVDLGDNPVLSRPTDAATAQLRAVIAEVAQ